MARGVLAVLAALVLIGAMSATALASPRWCEEDPIVVVDGQQVRIVTSVPFARLGDLSGPVEVSVVAPAGASVRVVVPPSHWFASTVSVAHATDAATSLTVSVLVRANASFPTQLSVYVAAGDALAVGGSSNVVTTVQVDLGR